jgi:hypothetical protein
MKDLKYNEAPITDHQNETEGFKAVDLLRDKSMFLYMNATA